jgi:hypothetical protein
MSSTDRFIDLGPFFPRKPLATPPKRDDGAAVAGPSGLAEGDMSTGDSKGGSNSKMKSTIPPITRNEDGSANRST